MRLRLLVHQLGRRTSAFWHKDNGRSWRIRAGVRPLPWFGPGADLPDGGRGWFAAVAFAASCHDHPGMHPFPARAQLQFLVGKEAGQICLDPWSVQLRFSDEGSITIEGRFQHLDAHGSLHDHHSGNERDVAPVYLRDLIQQRVVDLEVEPYLLVLKFANGAELRIHTDDQPYENGQISSAAGLIIF